MCVTILSTYYLLVNQIYYEPYYLQTISCIKKLTLSKP